MEETVRKMPDRLKDDWSNLPEVVEQFRQLGRNDTYILERFIQIAILRQNLAEFDIVEI